jgi:hypothetical protein
MLPLLETFSGFAAIKPLQQLIFAIADWMTRDDGSSKRSCYSECQHGKLISATTISPRWAFVLIDNIVKTLTELLPLTANPQ